MDYQQFLKELYQKNKIRIHKMPVKDVSISFILILAVTTWFVILGGGGSEDETAYGTYNPQTDEINIYLNESEEMYKETVYHENRHQELFQALPGFAPDVFISLTIFGLSISLLGMLTLRTDYWRYGVAMFVVPKILVESHAIILTFFKFHSVHSALYFTFYPVLWFFLDGLKDHIEDMRWYADSQIHPPIYRLEGWLKAYREWKELHIWAVKQMMKDGKRLLKWAYGRLLR